GIKNLSIDLCSPTLVGCILDELGVSEALRRPLRAALDRKDVAAVKSAAGKHAPLFDALLRSAGLAEDALPALAVPYLPRPGSPRKLCQPCARFPCPSRPGS